MDPNTSATSLFRQTGPSVDPVAFRPDSVPFGNGLPLPLPPLSSDTQPGRPDDDHEEPHRYRTIWLSDIHLGSSGCQAPYLLDCATTTPSIYIWSGTSSTAGS